MWSALLHLVRAIFFFNLTHFIKSYHLTQVVVELFLTNTFKDCNTRQLMSYSQSTVLYLQCWHHNHMFTQSPNHHVYSWFGSLFYSLSDCISHILWIFSLHGFYVYLFIFGMFFCLQIYHCIVCYRVECHCCEVSYRYFFFRGVIQFCNPNSFCVYAHMCLHVVCVFIWWELKRKPKKCAWTDKEE